jgi:tRNA nucleotidyltransferase/poly(A) polymerase
MTPRAFATDVVRTLRAAGFEALFAGGCVRDQLLGREPDDYDVATTARPDQVQHLFRRSVAVGAAFGVIEVLGPKPISIEVATFRSDGPYSDGRHPDSVRFTTARDDALRRDFTINGMFFDPLADRVIDYVGGERDLGGRIVRAIGEPAQRFREDRLRLLRAVRFAARLNFAIEPDTWAAIRAMAAEVTGVSAERVAEELRKLLTHPNRAMGARLLAESGLLHAILPEVAAGSADVLERLGDSASFELAFAALWGPAGARTFTAAAERLRLANVERQRIRWLVGNREALVRPAELPPHVLKPILAHAGIHELLALHSATGHDGAVRFVRDRLREWPAEALDPPPLVTGDDLKALGLTPGPRFKTILDAVRNAQLDGEVATGAGGLALARRLAAAPP